MRTNLFLSLTLLSLTACGAQHQSGGAQSTSAPTPEPLRACENRELTLDGVDMMLQANIDGSTAAITIVRAPDRDAQDKAVEEARKIFGLPHPDERTEQHTSKWGITEVTDPCGRPVANPSRRP